MLALQRRWTNYVFTPSSVLRRDKSALSDARLFWTAIDRMHFPTVVPQDIFCIA